MFKRLLLLVCGTCLALRSLTAIARKSGYNNDVDSARYQRDHREDGGRVVKVKRTATAPTTAAMIPTSAWPRQRTVPMAL